MDSVSVLLSSHMELAMFILAAFFNELGASHILTPMLVMELSTIVLAILRADFFTPIMQLVTQASFALLFFVARILIAPYVYYDIAMIMFDHRATCFPKSMFYVTLSFGAFFHSLNAFWFVKLVKKIQGKLSGTESMEMKDLNEE